MSIFWCIDILMHFHTLIFGHVETSNNVCLQNFRRWFGVLWLAVASSSNEPEPWLVGCTSHSPSSFGPSWPPWSFSVWKVCRHSCTRSGSTGWSFLGVGFDGAALECLPNELLCYSWNCRCCGCCCCYCLSMHDCLWNVVMVISKNNKNNLIIKLFL